MPYNASNTKEIRRAEKSAAELERARVEFLTHAMATPTGRTWFHTLLSECRLFSDPFIDSALREAYSKGERNVGLRIYLDIVTHCPEAFVTMMKEAALKELIDGRRTDPEPDSESDSDPFA